MPACLPQKRSTCIRIASGSCPTKAAIQQQPHRTCKFLQVSAECRDLMHKLLQPDPAKRASMAAIMEHPWFQRDLPPQLMSLNARCARQSNRPGDLQSFAWPLGFHVCWDLRVASAHCRLQESLAVHSTEPAAQQRHADALH